MDKMGIKKLFSLNGATFLNEKEKVLVENGVDVVKKYFAQKEATSSKKSFADLLGNMSDGDYQEQNEKLVTKICKYAVECADVGLDTSKFELSMVKNPRINRNQNFVRTFNAVIAQIMTPVVPAMISATYLDLADIHHVGWGDTAVFRIHSNDTFYVTRIAEGINQGTVQRLYNDELTVNPQPYNIKTTLDWYQVAAGLFDVGEYVYKVGYSFNAYITQLIVGSISNFVQAGITDSAAYFTNGFTTAKFATLADRLQAANAGAKVRAYGTLSALQAIIPEGAAGSSIANMQFELGEEWSKVGYIGEYKGVDLVRIPQIILPNTVNSDALFGLPNDMVLLMADGGYKPAKLVFEGEAITIDIDPLWSPDKEIGINVTMNMGLGFVAASKFGAITGVSLA